MTSHIPRSSRRVAKAWLVIALEFFLFFGVASRLNALGIATSWISSGVTARGKVIVFGHGGTAAAADAIKHPPPGYPYAERIDRHQGSGQFRMIIDPKTGLVARVLVEKSTEFNGFDDSAVETFQRWRWKPGTWKDCMSCVVVYRMFAATIASLEQFRPSN